MAFPFRIAIGAGTTSHAQGCASLSRWNGSLNRLYLMYRLFGFHSAQIVVQVVVLAVQIRGIPHTIAKGILYGCCCLASCIIIVKQTTDALVVMENVNSLVHLLVELSIT